MTQWWRFWQHPVLDKEFRERMRKRGTLWGITIYLSVIGLIVLTYFFLASEMASTVVSGVGEHLIIGLFVIQLITLALVVPGVTAGVISGERERQTLSILLTTPLSSSGIVIGKWLSSLSYIILLAISSLPLYAIVYLYGGISPSQLIKGFVHLFVSILFFGSLGIFASVVFKRTVVSTVVTYLLVAAVGIGSGILFGFWEAFKNINNINNNLMSEILMGLNPLISLLAFLIDDFNNPSIQPYAVYVTVYPCLTLLMVLLSIYFLSPLRWKMWSWRSRKKA